MINENILNPRDGQIEAKGYRIKLEDHIAKLYYEVGKEYYSTRSIYKQIVQFYGYAPFIPKSYLINEKLPKIQQVIGSIISAGGLLNNIGDAYNYIGQSGHALMLFKRSLELKRWDFAGAIVNRNYVGTSWTGLGYSQYQTNQIDEAISSFQKAIELDSKDPSSWEALGDIYRLTEQQDKAVMVYEEAIKANPKSPILWNGLGNVYYDSDEYKKAVSAYNKAIELNSSEATYWGNLGIFFSDKQQNR